MKKITAIIPVRKGSQRIVNKNIRQFYNSNLLTIKIDFLKKVKNIHEIIVSSDCDKMLKIAEDLGVNTHKRDEYYASSECPNHKYWKYLAKNVGKHDNVMMVNCTSPFIDNNIIEDILKMYNNKDELYDGLVTIHSLKKFLWFTDTYEPVNYEKNKTPNSQDLRTIGEITFGVCISTRENIINTSSIFGIKPYLYEVDNIKSIDIDNPEEFIISDLLYKKNLLTQNMCNSYMLLDSDPIKVLDCTIRDGGYLNNWNFSIEEVKQCYRTVSDSNVDYFEIGFRSSKKILNKGRWFYSTNEDINIIKNSYNGCKIAVMCKIGDFDMSDFTIKEKSDIDLIRLLIPRGNKYNLEKMNNTKLYIKKISELGYDICINLQNISHISHDEIELICNELYDQDIKCIYLADSYGNISENSLLKLIINFQLILKSKNSNLKLGFHGHNNIKNVLENSLLALDRNIKYIDGTISGIGRGGGNQQLEILLYEINIKYKKNYDVNNIINFINKKIILSKDTPQDFYYFISGKLNIHPNYISEIFNNKNILFDDYYSLIHKVYEYCKKNNNYNFDKNIIQNLIQ